MIADKHSISEVSIVTSLFDQHNREQMRTQSVVLFLFELNIILERMP
jgi:hypothetical protein